MIIDLNEDLCDPLAETEFDVCVCGGGVAGITLALNLSRKLNVLLLEAGGFEFSPESQSVYEGESVGEEYTPLHATRLRFLGGSSNHWGGWCRPLDSYDFEPRASIKYSGWPIRRPDLDPYLRKTESILDLSASDDWDAPGDFIGRTVGATSDFQNINFKLSSPPTRFGQKYQKEIERRSNVYCYLNASVTRLHLSEDNSRLDHVDVCNFSGKRFQARARVFVLAAGGIENPRILLNSNHQVPAGLGNRSGLVGKFFTDHLHAKVGEFILESHVREYLEENWHEGSFTERLRGLICESQGPGNWVRENLARKLSCISKVHRQYFSPSLEFMNKEGIQNFAFRFLPYEPDAGLEFDGGLTIVAEQALNPLSNISLTSELDQFGMRRLKLDWQLSEIDLHTIQRGVFRFGQTLADLDLGRLRVADWLAKNSPQFTGSGGNHHMCTTRMAETPDLGVVDRHQRVFGIDNLYVAGSSVFSSTGHANPTFTIVQMTLRLVDHIYNQLTKDK